MTGLEKELLINEDSGDMIGLGKKTLIGLGGRNIDWFKKNSID